MEWLDGAQMEAEERVGVNVKCAEERAQGHDVGIVGAKNNI